MTDSKTIITVAVTGAAGLGLDRSTGWQQHGVLRPTIRNEQMTDREKLRRSGQEIRHRLGLEDDILSGLSPGFANLTDEIVFGRVWARAGLELEDRMLATLSALTSVQYLDHLTVYTGAALHMGMNPRLIQEVMIHSAMYAGFPTAESSLRVVRNVLNEKGIDQPGADLTEVDLDEVPF